MKQLGIDDIPKRVQALPMLARHMWLRVYNRSIKINNPDASTKSAWAIVEQFYKRTPKGKWMKRP